MGDGYELALRREALATIANILGEAIGTAEGLRDSPISLAQVVVRHLSWMRERATQAEGERDKLRDLLRRVMAAPCDTSDGEYGTRPVREAMGPGFRGWSTTGEKNAALLAEVDAAVEVKP